jgi:predicted amidohydrolase YtcJ
MTRTAKLTVFAVALTASVVSMFGQEPDLVLLNGKIFTSDSLHPYVEAVAIRGDRIVSVGTSKTIASLAHSHTKRIDVGGRTVIPGINDAHDHIGIAPRSCKLPIKGNDPSWAEVRDALDTAVGKAPKGAFITGEIGATIVDDPQATRAPLDNRAPGNPVLLWDWTGHAVLLNTAALRKLAIAEDEPNPLGGWFGRNSEDRKLNGWAFEYAADRVSRKLTELTAEQEALFQMREYFNRAVRLGITTVQNMPVFAPEMCLALYRSRNSRSVCGSCDSCSPINAVELQKKDGNYRPILRRW